MSDFLDRLLKQQGIDVPPEGTEFPSASLGSPAEATAGPDVGEVSPQFPKPLPGHPVKRMAQAAFTPQGQQDVLQRAEGIGNIMGRMESPLEAGQREIAQIIGGTVGGGLGARGGAKLLGKLGERAGKAGGIFGGIAGAAGTEAGISLMADFWQPSGNAVENAKLAALYAAAGEGVFRLGAPIVGRMFGIGRGERLRKSFATLEGAEEAIKDVGEAGGVLLPGFAVDSRGVGLLQNIAEGSFGGGGIIDTARRKAEHYATAGVKQFVDALTAGQSRVDMGIVLKDALEEIGGVYRAFGHAAYKNVEVLSRGARVPIANFKRFVRKQAERGIGSPQFERIANRIEKKSDFISFTEAADIRSDLLGIGLPADEIVIGKAQATAKNLASTLDGIMMEKSKGLTREAKEAFRSANEFWKKEVREKFTDNIISSIVTKDPTLAYNAIIKNGRPEDIRRVKGVLINPHVHGGRQTWEAMRGRWMVDLTFEKAISETGRGIDGNKLFKAIETAERSGVYGELMTPELGKRFKRLASALQFSQGKLGAAGGGGKMLIQLTQATGLLGLAGGIGGVFIGPEPDKPFFSAGEGGLVSLGSVLLLGGPVALAKVLTNPSLAKAVALGAQSTEGKRALGRFVSQVAAHMPSEDIQIYRGQSILDALGDAGRGILEFGIKGMMPQELRTPPTTSPSLRGFPPP